MTVHQAILKQVPTLNRNSLCTEPLIKKDKVLGNTREWFLAPDLHFITPDEYLKGIKGAIGPLLTQGEVSFRCFWN